MEVNNFPPNFIVDFALEVCQSVLKIKRENQMVKHILLLDDVEVLLSDVSWRRVSQEAELSRWLLEVADLPDTDRRRLREEVDPGPESAGAPEGELASFHGLLGLSRIEDDPLALFGVKDEQLDFVDSTEVDDLTLEDVREHLLALLEESEVSLFRLDLVVHDGHEVIFQDDGAH